MVNRKHLFILFAAKSNSSIRTGLSSISKQKSIRALEQEYGVFRALGKLFVDLFLRSEKLIVD